MRNINEILKTYLKHENGDLNIFGKIIVIAIMFVATKFIVSLSDKLIDKTLSRNKDTNYFTSNKRANTI